MTIYFCSQIGPEKGVVHLAVAAVINALWDLWAKMEGKVSVNYSALCIYVKSYMGHVTTKPVFGVSDTVIFKLACSATETY